ncbi:MAG: IS21 family transposase [Solirubrobacteraceae bacterium]
MGSRVELFEQIRRDHEREGLSKRALAEKYGVHRRTVRQALESAVPPARKRPVGRRAPALGPYRPIIDAILIADRRVPRKQRHTARRIWRRLLDEHGAQVAERTVREYVAARRRELGEPGQVFVPQIHQAGIEAEVDWGEAQAVLAGRLTVVQLFYLRPCFSGAEFCMAFRRCTQQAFLEGHVEAFVWFGGVFALIRYDNLSAAVKLVLRGRRREETDRFIALRSHYLFDSAFTLAGLEGAHEKGGVEGEVGRFRRNHLVPVPEVADLAELNRLILAGCEADLQRTITGRSETVGEALARERLLLRALPAEPFDTSEPSSVRVDQKALVTVRQNRYSVPVALAGRRVLARVGAREIWVVHDGREVARHERLSERYQVSARLDHYLELLARKPGALAGSLALHQERERGTWPDCFDQLWQQIAVKVGASEAARQMVDVLMLVREHGAERVELAVRGALAAGAHDGRAVALLAGRVEERPPAVALTDLDPRLQATDRPPPDLDDYDQLLDAEAGR